MKKNARFIYRISQTMAIPSPNLWAAFTPQVLSLTAIAAVAVGFLFRNDSERRQWRIFLWTLIGVNLLYGVFGPFGYTLGISGLIAALWVYFVTFQKRQFSLLDMLLVVVLLGCFATMIATRYKAGVGS